MRRTKFEGVCTVCTQGVCTVCNGALATFILQQIDLDAATHSVQLGTLFVTATILASPCFLAHWPLDMSDGVFLWGTCQLYTALASSLWGQSTHCRSELCTADGGEVVAVVRWPTLIYHRPPDAFDAAFSQDASMTKHRTECNHTFLGWALWQHTSAQSAHSNYSLFTKWWRPVNGWLLLGALLGWDQEVVQVHRMVPLEDHRPSMRHHRN